MKKKQMGALLVSCLMLGNSMGAYPVLAEANKTIDEELVMDTVDKTTNSDPIQHFEEADLANVPQYEEFIDELTRNPLTITWEDDTTEHSFEWQLKPENIHIDCREGEGWIVSPYCIALELYLHLEDAEKELKEIAGEQYTLSMDDTFEDEEMALFNEWGWEGLVIRKNCVCSLPSETGGSLENWSLITELSAFNQDNGSRTPPKRPVDMEVIESELMDEIINIYVCYPLGDSREGKKYSLNYIPGTVTDVLNIDGTVSGAWNIQPYLEELKKAENIDLVAQIKNNPVREDGQKNRNYLGSENDGEYKFSSFTFEVTEKGVLPECPETIGKYVLINELTGEEITRGLISEKCAELTYYLERDWVSTDNGMQDFYLVRGVGKFDDEKVKEFIKEDTGITVNSRFNIHYYNFAYHPQENDESIDWNPYFTDPEDVIYFYTQYDSETEPVNQKQAMYRLYNPNSGEHFYTARTAERDHLISLGWNYESRGWSAPKTSNRPVYRVYNPNAGDHHYTKNKAEKDHLVSIGWNDEGIGWYSADDNGAPLYRQYNPNAKAGAHNYTTNAAERDHLVSLGWNDEGIGWYGLK